MNRTCSNLTRVALLVGGLTLSLAARALVALPDLASDSVIESVDKADQEISQKQYCLALARLEGVLYPKGVTVGFSQSSANSKRDQQFAAIRKAVGVWEKALDGDSPIQWNANNPSAEVVIQFVPSIPKKSRDTLGLIDLEKQYKWNAVKHYTLTSGTISVVVAHDSDPLTQEESQHVLMHELGHLLGLADVVETGFLMGPMERGNPLPTPTQGEIQAVIQIRKAVRQRIDLIKKRMQTDKGVATTEPYAWSTVSDTSNDLYEIAFGKRR